jgi:hypothetical protein
VLSVRGRDGLVTHRDANTLTRVTPPTPNPMALDVPSD